MTLKVLLMAGILGLVGLNTVDAKSFSLDISTPLKVGKLQLKPGTYYLTLEGDNATFKDGHGESSTMPVKVENGNKKFKATMVGSVGDRVDYIELGGTSMRLRFTE